MALSSAETSAIYGLLQNALSQEEAVRKPAEASLESIVNRPGFCSCLLEIIAAKELDNQGTARWLAAVYFKNSINRFWRTRRDTPGIGEEEKSHIRSKLLELLREENNQVATQQSLIISKIARFDYPREWSELFPNLVQKLQSPDILLTQRTYLTLNQVLKELSTKRLGVDQRNFAQITSQLFEYTWIHWYSDTQAIIRGLSVVLAPSGAMPADSQHSVSLTFARWLLCVKCIRRMMMFGFPSDFKSLKVVPAVQQLVPAYLEAIRTLLNYWFLAGRSQSPFLPFLQEASLKLLKSVTDVQATHPYSFSQSRDAMLASLSLCCDHVLSGGQLGQEEEEEGEEEGEEQKGRKARSSTRDAFLIQCMLFLQNVLKCVAYRAPRTGRVVGVGPTQEDTKGQLAEEARSTISTFFTPEKVTNLGTVLIQRYFMLTSFDLEEWDSDPEAFHHEQDQVQLRDRLRPCAEALFLFLFEHFKEILAPVVMSLLKQATEGCPAPPPGADVAVTGGLLLKDAVYDAVGVASYDLYDCVDFPAWYSSSLAAEVANLHPNNRILRRRTAWLLGQWVSKIKDGMRPHAYAALIGLLGDADMAVKLAACNSLRTLIDDVHFYEDEFVEFLEATLGHLFVCMQQSNEFDSQLQVLNLVSLITDRLGSKMVPYAERILTFLSQVWEGSGGGPVSTGGGSGGGSSGGPHSLLRIQVMLALQRLVVSLGPHSPLTYPLLFPILHHCTDVNNPDEMNMLEDGMQLWLATLRHCPSMAAPLLDLFPHLVPIMDRNFEQLSVSMRILESYILIGGSPFLHRHGSLVVQILTMVVGNVNDKGTLITLDTLNTLIQCFPMESPPVLETVLQKLLVLIVGGHKESDLVRAHAATLLARVLLQNTGYFVQLAALPSTAAMIAASSSSSSSSSSFPSHQQQQAAPQSPLLLFVDAWLDKLDCISSVAKQKLSALALCVLLTLPEAFVLERMEAIIGACTGVLLETEGDKSDGATQGYDYWAFSASSDDTDLGTSETELSRRRQVFSGDPVTTIRVAPWLKEKLQMCAAVHGEAAFNAAIAKLHPSLVSQLQHIMQQ